MFISQKISEVQLIRRQIPDSMIVSGKPQIYGRILSVAEDKRTARVIWQMIAGAVTITPDPKLVSVLICL